MASARAMKRAQGDALIRAAENVFGDATCSSSESEDDTPARRPANAFALLIGSDSDENDEDEEEEEASEPTPTPTPPKTEAVTTKKKKKKGPGASGEDLDDVTAALRELGEEMPAMREGLEYGVTESNSGLDQEDGKTRLLRLDKNAMKAEDELRFIFGARVIKSVEMEERMDGRRGGGGRVNTHTTPKRRQKSVLVTPKDTWPQAGGRAGGLQLLKSGSGFVMQCLGVDGNGKKTFKFSHDDKYVDARNSYESAKASHDPNALVRLLQTYPCNAQALLALSDIHMYTGEGQKSADILERCLFSLESSFHAWFWDEAVNGNARLAESLDGDFCGEAVRSDDRDDQNDLADTDANDSPTPNRTFLDALFKHTQALTRRGCHRAALECAKLALSLDATDPTGLLCAVDYFALRCGEVDWLVDFANGFREDGGLLVFPGFAFSTALARLGGGAGGRRSGSKNEKNNVVKKKDKKVKDVDFEKVKDDADKTTDSTHTADSTEALLRATLTHPAAVVALVEKLDSSTVTRDALWKTTLAHAHFADARAEVGNRGLEHLYGLFAERHHLLWKVDDVLAALRDACFETCGIVDDQTRTVDGLSSLDYGALRKQTWPATRNNPWRHLATHDFSDVVKRQMPEGDENPFLAQPAPGNGGANPAMDPEMMLDVLNAIRGGNLDPEAAAALGMDPDMMQALVERLNDPELGEAGGAQPGGPGAGLLDFFRTMFAQDGDAGGGLRREMARQNAQPQEEHED